jgi:hypothetical protein
VGPVLGSAIGFPTVQVRRQTLIHSVAIDDFSARGGDRYPFRGLPFTTVGVTYQQAPADFITTALGGQITANAYP